MTEERTKICDLAGAYQVTMEDGKSYNMRLPGTLAENGIGHRDHLTELSGYTESSEPSEDPLQQVLSADDLRELGIEEEEEPEEVIRNRYTRRFAYEGTAKISRFLSFRDEGTPLYLFVERARELTVCLDEEKLPDLTEDALPVPRVFDVTGKLDGKHVITFVSSNRYSEYPKSLILRSNMAANESATNWNGLLGRIELRTSLPDFTKERKKRVTVSEDGHFLCDGKKIFLRGIRNFACYPETAYPPMDPDSWRETFAVYQSYGFNFVIFDTWCPPEAAFQAADEAGFLVLVELSLQGLRAPIPANAEEYYRKELRAILKWYGHHPSFQFLSVGKSFGAGNASKAFFESLIAFAKEIDDTKLLTAGFPEPLSGADFYLLPKESENDARFRDGKPFLPELLPEAEILPDFREIDLFSGILEPKNLVYKMNEASEAHLLPLWQNYVEAGGETVAALWKAEIESLYLDGKAAGFWLSDFQDDPGYEKPLRGMLNSHLRIKPYDFAKPERFLPLMSDTVALLEIENRFLEYGETLSAHASLFNGEIHGDFAYCLQSGDRKSEGTTVHRELRIDFSLNGEVMNGMEPVPRIWDLTVTYGKYRNHYHIYTYLPEIPVCPDNVYETDVFDENAFRYLSLGGNVFLTPRADMTSGCHTVYQDKTHPCFARFPFTVSGAGPWAIFSDRDGYSLPYRCKSIVSTVSQYRDLERRSLLFEARCNGGNLFVSALGLKELLHRPEARALLLSIYDYLGSYDFSPAAEIEPEELLRILSPENKVRDLWDRF